MAPLDAQYAAFASARAELLVRLCHRNALVSFERLLALEVAGLRDRTGPPANVYSTTGDWFPDLSDDISPVSRRDRAEAITRAVADQGLNRQQKRQFKRQQKSLLSKASKELDPGQIAAEYPMRPEDAVVLRDYFAGVASHERAREAFLASLRDPSWMMQWFARHFDSVSHVAEWVRRPARELRGRLAQSAEEIRQVIEQASELREQMHQLRISTELLPDVPHLDPQRLADDAALGIVKNLSRSLLGAEIDNVPVNEIRRYTPGLTTATNTLARVAHQSTGRTPRKMKDSDFVDVLHSLYAPYVDVFRADGFMAPLVRQSVVGTTIVVDRLADLPAVIDDAVSSQQSRTGESLTTESMRGN